MSAYDKIRAALEMARELVPAGLGMPAYANEALAALAELEKAASEPVAWRYRYSDGKHGSAWLTNNNPPPKDDAAVADVQLLYAYPPAPVAEIREAVVTDEMCNRAYISKWRGVPELIDHEPDDEDRQWAREWLSAWRAELGPALGLVEIREPTPEECERISMAYYDDEALVDRDHRHLGKDMFIAVRAIMWPKESDK